MAVDGKGVENMAVLERIQRNNGKLREVAAEYEVRFLAALRCAALCCDVM